MGRLKKGHRRAGMCVEHDDLAWIYSDGSMECVHQLVVEGSSGRCRWKRMPLAWIEGGQEC